MTDQMPGHEQPPQDERGLARVVPESQVLTTLFGSVGHALHNFPSDPQEQFYLTAEALAEDCIPADEWKGEFRIRYWYVHSVQIERADGELVDCLRTVISDGQGNRVKFVSDGVAMDIRRIAQTFGLRPYNPPVVVRIATIRTGRGRKLIRLVPVRPDKTERTVDAK